jgi:acyl phosphate:glycerol-3-phosphate acyltransferase
MFDDVGLIILVACFSYGLGSIPFGLILTKLAGAGDIRQIGSGNIGATNVLRTGNKKLAIATLICDASKGVGVIWLVGQTTTPALTALASILVVAGHCFPIWLKFNGGKGVATSLAVMAALDLRLGAVFVFVWLVTAFLSRYSSLSALLAMGTCVVAGFGLIDSKMIKIALLVLSCIVWSRHHTNIGRLLSGTETKIGKKNPKIPRSKG